MSVERESLGGGAVVVDPLGGLIVDPSNELRFRGPFDDYVTVSLTIRNPTSKRVAFKIKTTAPKRYCVKPNSGVLDPEQIMKVNVLLQPFNYDPSEKNKHKFMVQYLYLNEEEMQLSVNDILNMWKDVSASRLLDLKLKCIFEFTEAEQQKLASQMSDVSTIQSNTSIIPPSANTTLDSNISKTQLSSQTAAQLQKPAQTAAAAAAAVATAPSILKQSVSKQANDVSHPDFDSYQHSNTNNAQTNSSNLANNKTPVTTTAATPVGKQISDKNDNLANELKLAQQENEALKIEITRLKDEEQRLRKLALTSPKGGPQQPMSLTDLANNRLVLVIVILVAIIFYLLLFR